MFKTQSNIKQSKVVLASASAEKPKADSKSEKTTPKRVEPKTVTVQVGDYLNKIARINDTTALRLFYANTDIKNPDLIYPNQKLAVPTADDKLTVREVPVSQQLAKPTQTESASAAAPQHYAQPAPQPVAVAPAGNTSVWDSIAACESGGNWAINTGNGYYGGVQFSLSSWRGVGGSGLPSQASKSEQVARAQMLQARQGWGAWPACTTKLGIR